MASYIIYLCTNKINGKKYVGYTSKTIQERKKGHYDKANKALSTNQNLCFQNALLKYKKDDFVWEVLEVVYYIELAFNCEKKWISSLNTKAPFGYNLTDGGAGAPRSIKIKKPRQKTGTNHNFPIHLRVDLRNRMVDFNERVKSGEIEHPLKGFKHADESKNKMSQTQRQKNKHVWYNFVTKEVCVCCVSDMNEYCNRKSNVFSHLANKRMFITNDGWVCAGTEDSTYVEFDTISKYSPKSKSKNIIMSVFD